jgi:hypothetical protein
LFERVKERGGIVQFHGLWCAYCWGLKGSVSKLEKTYGLYIERREVWLNPVNILAMRSLSDLFGDFNMGFYTVPSFYDPSPERPRDERLLVNPGSYEMLEAWYLEGRK